MSLLDRFNLEDLKEIHSFISQYSEMGELRNDLDFVISSREKEKTKSLNQKFDLDMMLKYQIFTYEALQVILANSITNLQDLIDCDLDQLEGITPSVKRELNWIRSFYDMRSLEPNNNPLHK